MLQMTVCRTSVVQVLETIAAQFKKKVAQFFVSWLLLMLYESAQRQILRLLSGTSNTQSLFPALASAIRVGDD